MTRTRLVFVATAVALACTGIACADNVVSPASRLKKTGAASLHALTHGHVIACTRRDALSDSATIGPSGGILRLGNNELLIPGGALLEPVTIRADVPSDTVASIRFYPEGLQFRKPVGLVIDADGCGDPGEAAKILYLDEEGTVLEEIDAEYDPRWKRVSAPINHFSRYALGV
jgi:hypothetical protein